MEENQQQDYVEGLIPKYDEPFKVMQKGIGSLQIEVTKQPKGIPHDPCELLKALSFKPSLEKDTGKVSHQKAI